MVPFRQGRHFRGHQTRLVDPIHTVIAGRVRFKVRGLKQSTSLKHSLELYLSSQVGIERVSASVLTGNVLVIFSQPWRVSEIAALIKDSLLEYCQQLKLRPKQSSNPSTRPKGEEGALMSHGQSASLPRHDPSHLPWHTKEIETITSFFDTSPEIGLSHERAQLNLQRYGANTLPEPKPRSGLRMVPVVFSIWSRCPAHSRRWVIHRHGGHCRCRRDYGGGSDQRLFRLCH